MSSLLKPSDISYMKHDSIILQPCPKCKSRMIDCLEEFNNIYPQGRFVIRCEECLYTVGSTDLDLCLKNWSEGK